MAHIELNCRAADDSVDYYRPLSAERKEFRLLIVQPWDGSDIVRGWLRHATLDHELLPHYETISYCWGNSGDVEWMIINNVLRTVPASAEAAVARMRYSNKQRMLWIDAICIEQRNLKERSMQVAAMNLVYSRAARNLIYLGDDEDEIAETAVKALTKITLSTNEEFMKLSKPHEAHKLFERRGLVPGKIRLVPISEEIHESLFPLYELPWFQRLWVVQEAALAVRNKCFWGRKSFPLEAVLWYSTLFGINVNRVRAALYSKGLGPAAEMQPLLRTWPEFTPRQFLPLEYFHRLSEMMLATEPRDYVFAVVGLYQRLNGILSTPSLLQPDYEKPIFDVYRDATRYMLHCSNHKDKLTGLGGLIFARLRHRSQIDLKSDIASWTVRWDRKYDSSLDFSCIESPSFRAGTPPHIRNPTGFRLKIADAVDWNVITLKGFAIGTVCWLTPPLMCIPYPPEELSDQGDHIIINDDLQIDDVGTVLGLVESIKAIIDSGTWGYDELYSLLAQVLSGGANDYDPGITSFHSIVDKTHGMEEFLRSLEEKGSFPLPLRKVERPQDMPYSELHSIIFHELFKTHARHRRVIKINSGYLGLGPRILKDGDLIAVLEGDDYPVALRPYGDKYQFVGVCFVHGLMEGQAFELNLPSVWFDIR